jgi:hypothetical protein
MATDAAEIKAAYAALDLALRDVLRIQGAEGLLTEWVSLCAIQRYDDDGDALTSITMLLPDGGGQVPYHRLLGLIEYARTVAKAEIAANECGRGWDADDS